MSVATAIPWSTRRRKNFANRGDLQHRKSRSVVAAAASAATHTNSGVPDSRSPQTVGDCPTSGKTVCRCIDSPLESWSRSLRYEAICKTDVQWNNNRHRMPVDAPMLHTDRGSAPRIPSVSSGNPAIVGRAPVRPLILRPRLSPGLPFSDVANRIPTQIDSQLVCAKFIELKLPRREFCHRTQNRHAYVFLQT